jgi:hypothetical protein
MPTKNVNQKNLISVRFDIDNKNTREMSYYLKFLKEFLPTSGNKLSVFVGTQTTHNVNTTTHHNYGGGVLVAGAATAAAITAMPSFYHACERISESAGKLYYRLKPASLDFGRNEIAMRCCDGTKLVVKFDASVTDSVKVKFISNQGEETEMKVDCDRKAVSCVSNTYYSRDCTAYARVTGPNDKPGAPERIDGLRFGHKWLCVIHGSGNVFVLVHSLPNVSLLANLPDTPAKAKKLDFCKQIK